MIITFEKNKKQHSFTLLLYLCIYVEHHVKFVHVSWNSNPSPATRVNWIFLMKGRHHTGRSYFFCIMVKKGVETRINKIIH